MGMKDVATALERARTVLARKPAMGVHDDAPATARWGGGTRIEASHANGTRMETDMPAELGGSGDRVSPGWLFRAGIASCAATTIAMRAVAGASSCTPMAGFRASTVRARSSAVATSFMPMAVQGVRIPRRRL